MVNANQDISVDMNITLRYYQRLMLSFAKQLFPIKIAQEEPLLVPKIFVQKVHTAHWVQKLLLYVRLGPIIAKLV